MIQPTTPLLKQDIRRGSTQVIPTIRAMLNEVQKSLWLLWRHRFVVLTEFIALAIFYPLMQFLMSSNWLTYGLMEHYSGCFSTQLGL